MSRSRILFVLAACVTAASCNAIAAIAGAPKIVSVEVLAPAGIFVGETAQATANALGDDGKMHPGRTVNWRSSDPAALSIDPQGKIVGLLAGRTATITAEVDGKTGSANVAVSGDDARFAYAVGDQPTLPGPYTPAAGNSFTTGSSTEITRTSEGMYSVRFDGLGRLPGYRDNVQVSAINATTPVYCKPGFSNTVGADLVVVVRCYTTNGTPIDSRFTVLALGAMAFGRTTPLAFLMNVKDSSAFYLDTAVTAYNSGGDHIGVGFVQDGMYAIQFKGLEAAWSAAPAAIQVSPVGPSLRRCRLLATDATTAGMAVACSTAGGGAGNTPFSVLWMQRGRPSKRFGFAYGNNVQSPVDYAPDPKFAINSSGGAIAVRRTAVGQYRIQFNGLARPPGASEAILVNSFLTGDSVCYLTSSANSGNDLVVNVACAWPSGALNNNPFAVLVIE